MSKLKEHIDRLFRSLMGEDLFLVWRENITNPLTWSLLIEAETLQVTHRIRKYILNGHPKEAWRLKESFKDTFAMEAVAAAIIAQIAITMPTLPNFGSIHWTASALAYTSLVCGLLSTYFSFYVQQVLSDLHNPEDVRDWLTSPRIRSFPTFWRSHGSHPNDADEPADICERIPSITAAAALVAPSRLLLFAIMTLFLSMGIYLGSVYTAKLGTLKGRNANLSVFLFFIIVMTWSILQLVLPLYSKRFAEIVTQLSRDQGDSEMQSQGPHHDRAVVKARMEAKREGTGACSTSETQAAIQQALQLSIHAQEESLNAHKALLQILLSQAAEITPES